MERGYSVVTQQSFPTGAVRDTANGKVRLDLLPWPELERVARHYMRGMEKYAARNWEKGIPSSRCLQSLLRHVSAVAQGKGDEDHLSAVVFNALAIAFNERVFHDDPTINDLPGYQEAPQSAELPASAPYPQGGEDRGCAVRPDDRGR